jgi:hypothetical protein
LEGANGQPQGKVFGLDPAHLTTGFGWSKVASGGRRSNPKRVPGLKQDLNTTRQERRATGEKPGPLGFNALTLGFECRIRVRRAE